METGVVNTDDSTKIIELPPPLPTRPALPTVQLAQVSIVTREVNNVAEKETTQSQPQAPALPPRPITIASNHEQPSIEELEEDLEIPSIVTPLVNEEHNTTQQTLYTSLPINPTSQIRVLELQPSTLNSPIICNLVVQNIDLTTPRRPPPTIHGDILGDMFTSKGVVDYFRRNTSKDDFIRDLRTWMPKSHRERHQEKVVAAHAAESALPAFNALSYTWGSWDDSTSITIVNSESGEEVEFPVTRNLFNALRRIRRGEDDVIRLWVDQICINQRDEEEKAWQVRAMGNIYSLAWDVFIWLGDLDDEDLEPLKSNGPEARHQIAERLLEVMEHAEATWWTRTWCIQEFMMARQDPIAIFADCQMRWTEVVNAGKRVKDDRELRALKPSNLKKHIWKNDDSNKPESEAEENDPVEIVGAPFFSFQRIKYMSSGVRTLASMYWAYSQTEATDPRDKVYSLLALIEPAESALVAIDYKKPVPWVYAEATYASIMASGNIHILGMVKGDRSELELPSWCVDFSYAGKAINQSWIDTGDFSQYLFAPIDASREAKRIASENGGDNLVLPWTNRLQCATAKASLSVRRQLLVLRGLEFDVVVRTIHKRTRKVYWNNLKTGALDLLKAPLGLFSDGPVMLTKNEQAAFQSVLDLVEGAGSPYGKLAQHTGVPGSFALKFAQEDSNSTTSEDEEKVSMFSFRLFDVWSRRFLRGHVSGLTKVAWRRYGLWKLYFRHLCHGDAFFFTSNGFMGLGHIDCQVGDRIVLPYGSRHPVLLRPDTEANRYKFLGFCFVNGIMNDELRKLAPDLVLSEKEFVLR
ncbi:hypothetical protein CBER1_08889 [Cercospora berteroae]|uniref:Heterokaryon incompatibility domain-containing protein n=1 Tax=Cercospora berteroae TaxID=357750 RepID=A0A2S6BW64_9PEZI|nr:hypothetical protein CBER1_08889 [Cercospora berteroae]